jgi:WD40 repeat protein
MWVGISPDSTKLASVAWDGTVRIWSVETGECLHTFGNFGGQMWTGVWSPDSKLIAFSQGSPKTVIYVYNVETSEEISRFEGFKQWARSIAWSPDGKYLVSGGQGGVLCVWDPTTGKEAMRWELTFGDENGMMKMFVSIEGVTCVGTKLVFQSTEGTVEAYDFQTNLKSQFARGPDDKIDSMVWNSLAVSHNGKFVVSGDADCFVRIWNL